MARKYGLPYKGSKNAIAEQVVDNLPPADTLVDIFAGGCAVTHAAMVAGKYKHYIANDINGVPQVFADVLNGEYENYDFVANRAQFHAMKETDPIVSILYSFSNNRIDYLWSGKYENVKVAAEQMLVAPSLHQRRMAYKKFLTEFIKYIETSGTEKVVPGGGHGLQGLQGLEALERVDRLQGLEGLERLEGVERLQGLERLEGVQTIETLNGGQFFDGGTARLSSDYAAQRFHCVCRPTLSWY